MKIDFGSEGFFRTLKSAMQNTQKTNTVYRQKC